MTKSGKTREMIIEHALRSSSLDGLDGLSLRDVATAAGLSKSGLFAHFGSKEELQRAVIEAAIRKFRALVVVPTLQIEPGVPQLRALFENWIAWERDESIPGGCPFVPASAEFDDQPGLIRSLVADGHRRSIEFIESITRDAIRTGALRSDLETDVFALQFMGIILAYFRARRLLDDADAEQRASRALRQVIASAQAREETR